YTARRVSKVLLFVSKVIVPEVGAVHVHHIECEATCPGYGAGSPASAVALAFVPVAVPLEPDTRVAEAKLSFEGAGGGGGGGTRFQFSETLPVAPFELSTSILYSVPEIALKLTW